MNPLVVRFIPRQFWPFMAFALALLATLAVSRLTLSLWHYDHLASPLDLLTILATGVRYDLITAAFLLLLPVLLTCMVSPNQRWLAVMMTFNRYYLAVVFGLSVFIEASTPDFINQYGVRPNVWFVEYLKYPQEVFAMLVNAYLPSFILGLAVSLLAGYFFLAHLKRLAPDLKGQRLTWLASTLWLVGLFIGLTLCIRSSLGHRPISPAYAAFSEDALVNSLPLNSFYSAGYAGVQLLKESAKSGSYYPVDNRQLQDIIPWFSARKKQDFISAELPTLHKVEPQQNTGHKNLVIILEESLGAEYVGRLGGVGVTPNIERLGAQGWWFEQMYATGTRSARGIEAVVTGFLPTRAQSTIKRAKSREHFFTIAELLKSQGYQTNFIYGGDSSFDNMRGFFLANGFDQVFDQHDFVEPIFTSSWGVSDEDLFNQAHHYLQNKDPNTPFFTLIFTSSNHSPFLYPQGRIEPFEGIQNSGASAVRYADYALGAFFDQAKQSSYYDNTLFLVVADHASRVFGKELFPLDRFHIPAFILGKDLAPKVTSRVVSQIDLLPTLLSLMAIDSPNPMLGLDLTRADLDQITPKNLMQYADVQAYRENDDVVILRPDMEPVQFKWQGQHLQPVEKTDQALLTRAKAISYLPNSLYENRQYQSGLAR